MLHGFEYFSAIGCAKLSKQPEWVIFQILDKPKQAPFDLKYCGEWYEHD